jgi:hypothetical protein
MEQHCRGWDIWDLNWRLELCLINFVWMRTDALSLLLVVYNMSVDFEGGRLVVICCEWMTGFEQRRWATREKPLVDLSGGCYWYPARQVRGCEARGRHELEGLIFRLRIINSLIVTAEQLLARQAFQLVHDHVHRPVG